MNMHDTGLPSATSKNTTCMFSWDRIFAVPEKRFRISIRGLNIQLDEKLIDVKGTYRTFKYL